MLCRTQHKKSVWIVVLVAGFVTGTFGVLTYFFLSEGNHAFDLLSGFCTGFGYFFFIVSIINLVKLKVCSPEKLKQDEIEWKDERNVQIMRLAFTIMALVSVFLLAALAVVCLLLGYSTPAWLAIGAIYLELLVFFVAYFILSRRM